MIIEIDGISIEISRKPIKNMNLRIYPPDGLVKVSAPLRYSDRLIRQHLQEKCEWIRAQRERIRERSSFKEENLQTGETIAFQGKNYLLIIEEHHGPSKITVDGELIHFFTQPHTTLNQKQIVLDRWYRREMESLLPELIKHWETIINVRITEWGIKKMKTRWGSCNTRARRIWLNLNLIKKPLVCLEYVLVHELVHLLEASHNKRFYALMTQFMPQWREYQYILEGKASAK
ncbi:M48 family metallopeptidase [Legionella quateirensis]|uniref:Metal-dependent hydrolase n=1 Tax=Legionella quateirensis TaxID=45072 RepID=A0A378KT14_9GAMM|nr:SprT family zinc-dependent metalloprotease [Legionella quateirensis]KTD55364.1 zinc metalloprotease [Legionella quateirensis]STY16538.1 metal-dependent hydrolase [Legionella quateirensis]